jgi:predicted Zn-dependent protease
MNQTIRTLTLLAATAMLGSTALLSQGCGGGSGPGGGTLGKITSAIPGLSSSQKNDAMNLARLGAKGLDLLDLDSPQRQQEIGESVAVAITNRYRLSTDQKLTDYVNLVGLTVAPVSPKTDIDHAFGVLDTDQVSAYSAPGGYIFITRGAMRLIEDESELAAVLAHEVAHVALNHGIDAVKQAKTADLGATAIKTQSDQLAAYGKLVDEGFDTIVVKGFSREQESRADSEAVKYLAAAGYDPAGLVRFLQRLQSRTGAGGGLQQLMSTHPATAERVATVRRQVNAMNPTGVTLEARYKLNVGS